MRVPRKYPLWLHVPPPGAGVGAVRDETSCRIAAVTSGFEGYFWIGPQRDQLLATGNPVLEPPETRAARVNEKIKAIPVEKLDGLFFGLRISDRDVAEVHGGTTSSS